MTDKAGGLRLTDQQRVDWLRLIRSENIGPRTFRALINEFGGAARALTRVSELARRGGRREIRVASQADPEAEIKAAAQIGIRFVAIGEEFIHRACARPTTRPHLSPFADSLGR